MKKSLLPSLICPNTGKSGFKVIATKLLRNGRIANPSDASSIEDSDEIAEGLLITGDGQFAYPIKNSVLSLLSDEDADINEYNQHFDNILPKSSGLFRTAVEKTKQRLERHSKGDEGKRNQEEMKYYDAEVDTPAKRANMQENIKSNYLPHIFLPRQEHIISPLLATIGNKIVIEIGCGNARTISYLMPPKQHSFSYIGTDISFWRLVVAKEACPEGEFIQASALNLPIRSDIADVGISFGMLHHLSSPAQGLKELDRTLKLGGYLAIHEPILTKKIIAGRLDKVTKWLQTYEHSENDDEIDLREFLEMLDRMRYKILRRESLASPFRTISEAAANKIGSQLLSSRGFYKILFALDQICISTVCHISRFLEPRGVIMLARHNQ